MPKKTSIKMTEKKPSLKEFGKTATNYFDGVFETEYLKKLDGQNGIAIYEKMRRSDPQIKMILSMLTQPLMSAKYIVNAYDAENENDVFVAKFIDKQLKEEMTITWAEFIGQVLSMLPFGHSIFEKIYGLHEDKEYGQHIQIVRFAQRQADSIATWNVNKDSGILESIEQNTNELSSFDGITIPAKKLLVFTVGKEGANYPGISILRPSYKPWFQKNIYEKMLGIGIERYAVKTPVGMLPESYSLDDKKAFETALENYITHEKNYILLPNGFKVEFPDSEFDAEKIDKVNESLDRSIAKSVLVQFIELGQGTSGGAYALGADQSDFFLSAIQFFGDYICEIINRNFIREYVDYNFEVENYPYITCVGINKKAGKELAESLDKLVGARLITPDKKLESHVRETYDLPEQVETTDDNETKPKKTPEVDDVEDNKKDETDLSEIKLAEWRRSLTTHEKQINLTDIDKTFEFEEEKLLEIKKNRLNFMKEKLLADIEKAVADKTTARGLEKIEVGHTGKYKDDLKKQLAKIVTIGIKQATKEVNKVKLDEFTELPSYLRAWITVEANNIVGFESEKLKAVGLFAGLQQFQNSASTSKILYEAKQAMNIYIDSNALVVGASLSVSKGINEGRNFVLMNATKDGSIVAVQYSAILDTRTCPLCAKLDKTIYSKEDPANQALRPPEHAQCRCVEVPVGRLVGDEKIERLIVSNNLLKFRRF